MVYKPQINNGNSSNSGDSENTTPPNPALSSEDLARLDGMSREEIIALVKALPARITGYALQTKEERREAMRLKVYEIAMSAANDAITLKAANDWLDREEGKSVQREVIDMRVGGEIEVKHLKARNEHLDRILQASLKRQGKLIDVTPKDLTS